MGGITKTEGILYTASATAGLGVLESVNKQASDDKIGLVSGTQVINDVCANLTLGALAKTIEPNFSSNGDKRVLETASEAGLNIMQNKLNNKPTQNPYHNQNRYAPQALENPLR